MENRSETIGKLAEALSKAQGAIKGAVADAENPFFKSTYANLASVWEACRKPLSDNGLSVVQLPRESPDMVSIETVLMHVSGEWISGIISMRPMKQDPQSYGSCWTYARRYSLSSIVGIAPLEGEDDDAETAMGRTTEDKKLNQEPQKKYVNTPSGNVLSAICQITNLSAKQGLKKDNKTYYTLFTITGLVDGKEMVFRTFSKTISEIVSKEKNVMTLFEIKYNVSQYGNDIESLKVVEPESKDEGKEAAQ